MPRPSRSNTLGGVGPPMEGAAWRRALSGGVDRDGRGKIALLSPALAIFAFCFVGPISYFLVISFWKLKRFKLTPAFTLENCYEVYDEYSWVLVFTFGIALAIGVHATYDDWLEEYERFLKA